MKKLLIALVAAATTATALPATAQVNARQWRQQERIADGYYDRQITPREYRRLQQQQRRIARYEHRSRWDGRGLSYRERARLERMQDRASRNIYRQRRDWQGYDRRGYYGDRYDHYGYRR